jgi:hypothetical protein
MMQEHKTPGVALGLVAVALVAVFVAVACRDSTTPVTAVRADIICGGSGCVPPPTCITGKWTGGGRIDPTGDASRTAANDDAAPGNGDEQSGGQPPPPNPPPFIIGKVTFGFNVFLGSDPSGQCIVNKGEIEVNGHVAKVAWHVSIHNGVDDFSGRPVFATTFPDGHTMTHGRCLVVGVESANFMVARVNPGNGRETVQFEVCDNDRGFPQNSRSDAMRWRAKPMNAGETGPTGDTGLTFLTGGNVVDHS